MNGRVYDPLVGRFLSGDDLVEDPSNGQSYNRYSYVLNNPTNLVDPTGFNSDCPGKDSGDCKPEPPKVEVPGTKDSTAKAENRAFAMGQYNIRAFMSGSPTPGGNFQIHVVATKKPDGTNRPSVKMPGVGGAATGGGARLRQGAGDLRALVALRQSQPWYQRMLTYGSEDDLLEAADTQDELADAIDGDGGATGRLLLKTVVLPMASGAISSRTGGGKVTVISVSRKRYPESAQHIADAQAAGHPSTLTVDRTGAAARRREALKKVPTVKDKDRDEYPPAMFKEGGKGASVRPIDRSDNRGAGACIGQQCSNVPDGGKVEIRVVD